MNRLSKRIIFHSSHHTFWSEETGEPAEQLRGLSADDLVPVVVTVSFPALSRLAVVYNVQKNVNLNTNKNISRKAKIIFKRLHFPMVI